MSQLQIQLDRIRRRWVLILVIGIVAAAGALGAAAVQGTTYTGRATLTIVSPDRAPEQDTPLAQGYADIFNQTSSQQELRDQAGVTADVTLNARIAAASPIVYVEATGRDAAQAQDAATKMAVALRDQINSGVGRGDTDQQRQQLTRDLAAAQARGDNGAISRIQGDIRDLDAGGTNELRDLQLNAGVAPNSTNAVRNAGAALAGGLLFGIALALALGRFENRIVTPNEVRDRLGLPVLAEVNGGKRRGDKGDARSALLHSLMGLTDAYGMPSPGTLAITGPKSTRATKSKVAIAIAGLRALQGQQTLLLQTDLDGEGTARELADLNGVAEFLAERTGARVDGKVFSNGRALLVGPPGRRRNDVFALYSKPHMQRLLQQGIALADLVIVDAPPAETVEGQIVCGTADRSLLVVEEGQTRARDATGALDSLQRVGSTALGVVLVRNPAQLNDGGFLSEGPWNPVALPPPPNKPAPSAPSAAPAASTPAPAAAAATPVVQYQPANRTQPITREKLDEARAAAAARESAANNAAAAGPTNGAGHGSANGTNGTNGANGTNGGTNGATNGAALGAAAGLAAAAGAAGAASSAPSAPAGPPTPGRGSGDGGPKNGDNGSSGAPDGRGAARPGAPSPAAGPAGPASGPTPSPRPQPSPGSGDKRPSPTPSAPKPGGPAGTGTSASGPTGAGPAAKAGAAAGTAAANAAPGNGKPGQGAAGPKPGGPNAGQTTNGGQNTNGGQGNGAPKAQPTPGPGPNAPSGPASPAGSSGPHPRPGGPAPQAGSPSPAPQATAQGQQKAPSSPEQGAGTGPNVRRPAGGARPSPRPKPSPSGSGPSPSGSGPSASAGQAGATGASTGSPSRAASPSPAGSKRIGTARFVDGATPHSANGGAANGGSRPSAGGANGTTGTNGGSTPGGAAPGGGDRLAAPTVTMRPEK